MKRMKVEVIKSDIPQLMLRKAMEKAGIILDFKEKKLYLERPLSCFKLVQGIQ